MPRLLVLIPHPDDESYSFAGTIALATSQGWTCQVHCATFGEGGERHDGGDPDPGMLALARARELDASCRLLGAELPEIWGLPDGGLADRKEGPRRTRSAIRKSGADLVLSLGSDGVYGHPDHLVMHRWALHAWQAVEDAPPLLFAAFPPGLFAPQYRKCQDAGVMGHRPSVAEPRLGVAQPDYRVDISSVADVKRAAIGLHLTQLPGGEPEAMFPEGIVASLLATEAFVFARAEDDAKSAVIEGTSDEVRALLGI